MKKSFKNVLTIVLVSLIVPMACTKSGSDGARVPLPDLSDFRIESATQFAAGTGSTVNVYCSSIGSGTYQVHYDLTGSNTFPSESATLVMNSSYGSFKTRDLPDAGHTYLTINSITNSKGGGTALISNNKYTLSDSTGLMMATIGENNVFKTYDVLATLTDDSLLTIRGTVSEPYKATITLYVHNYAHTNGAIDFSSRDIPEKASVQYQVEGGGTRSANGTINIMTVSPLLSGTFSFTGMDSTKVTSGSFSSFSP